MKDMAAVTKVEVDFRLTPDGEHSAALITDLGGEHVAPGQRLLASDGDVSHWAVVDTIDKASGLLSLRILWDKAVPVA